ncbi:MAG: NAD(+)/NADH kinase, partial [candidate division Zixibacteria bacterium]|nr:NAD(+)/NADH kinase [candidate division Zixibacteria bacterium]
MRFGLVANLQREGTKQAVSDFLDWSKQSGTEIFLWDGLKEIAPGQSYCSFEELPEKCDVLVSMGGDGTLIHSARAVGDRKTKLLGVNVGSLGFLTQITPQSMIPCLDRIVKGDYSVEERMALTVKIDRTGETFHALNEAVVDNGPISRMIDIRLQVNGEDIVNYRCDGLIIATPTGSTAYSLASGGPILHPTMQAIIASPISAFSLTTRPMIFRADDALVLKVRSQHKVASLTVDGQVMRELLDGDVVSIKRADFAYQFISFEENSFYRVCRSKLHWGVF